MGDCSFFLMPIGDFISLLCEKGEDKNMLQKRFKKDAASLSTLYEIIKKVDELGYKEGMDFAYNAHYIAPIAAHGNLSLIEIRVRNELWRVLAYHSLQRKHLVMLDAFENHKGVTMNEMVERVKQKRSIAKELLKEVD